MKIQQRGFTLVELTITLVVLAVGVLATAATLGSLTRLGDERTVETRRTMLVRNAIAALKSVPFEEAPVVLGPGAVDFICHADGTVTYANADDALGGGRFEFFTDESSIPEGFADLSSGYDLNDNGVIDGPVTDYRVLPVRITISLVERGIERETTNDFFFRKW